MLIGEQSLQRWNSLRRRRIRRGREGLLHGKNFVVGDAHGLGDDLCGDAEANQVAGGFLLGFVKTDLFSFDLSFNLSLDFGFFLEIFDFLSVYQFDGTGHVGILVLFHVVGEDVDDIFLFFCFGGELAHIGDICSYDIEFFFCGFLKVVYHVMVLAILPGWAFWKMVMNRWQSSSRMYFWRSDCVRSSRWKVSWGMNCCRCFG